MKKEVKAVGVIEIVLILVILIGLVLIFKEQITGIVTNAFSEITGDADKIMR
ncbi:MAG: holin, BlyA family protein [Lachnospiraceae bacterium]|nr:holin, BlyA family protein [Lachnospiraceae bacterium]